MELISLCDLSMLRSLAFCYFLMGISYMSLFDFFLLSLGEIAEIYSITEHIDFFLHRWNLLYFKINIDPSYIEILNFKDGCLVKDQSIVSCSRKLCFFRYVYADTFGLGICHQIVFRYLDEIPSTNDLLYHFFMRMI